MLIVCDRQLAVCCMEPDTNSIEIQTLNYDNLHKAIEICTVIQQQSALVSIFATLSVQPV